MKKTIILMGALFIGACAYAAKPNVVIVYADDMGYGDASFGNKESKIQTPHIDALANSGMRFLDGHSSSGICTPSRYAMLTGQHHWRSFHGICNAFAESKFKPDDFTLPKMFKACGYKTAMIGKWHLGWGWKEMRKKGAKGNGAEAFDWTKKMSGGPTSIGFDYYYGDGTINFPPYCWIENDIPVTAPTRDVNNTTDVAGRKEGVGNLRQGPASDDWKIEEVLPTLTKKAVEYISQQNANEPFFLYLALNSPHAPIAPAKEFWGKSQAGYFGDFVIQSDDTLGRVVAELERKGLIDNTIIIFTADNGAESWAYDRQAEFGHWSSGPFRGAKRDLFEGGHHVPFVVSWKGTIDAGIVSDTTINQVDFAATFAGIIGYDLKKDEAQDSFDMISAWKSENKGQVRDIMVHNTNNNAYALRQGDWVYIDVKSGSHNKIKGKEYIPSDTEPTGEGTAGLLYNLKEDIAQVNNVYEQHPEKVKEMKALLTKYVKGKKPTAPHSR
ncbi:MAG: arylsulfatase [Opitutales bacterium]